jgi:hypothetical protein
VKGGFITTTHSSLLVILGVIMLFQTDTAALSYVSFFTDTTAINLSLFQAESTALDAFGNASLHCSESFNASVSISAWA